MIRIVNGLAIQAIGFGHGFDRGVWLVAGINQGLDLIDQGHV
jgi:hypothetical protein